MSRLSTVRKPTVAEFRQRNQLVEGAPTPRQQRKAQALVLHYTGMNARDMAASLVSSGPRGAPARINARQADTARRVAETPPIELGEPYGHWSLATLRAYLIRHHILKAISREHLRQVLKRRALIFDAQEVTVKACPDGNPAQTIFSTVRTMILDSSNDPNAVATRRRISTHLRRLTATAAPGGGARRHVWAGTKPVIPVPGGDWPAGE